MNRREALRTATGISGLIGCTLLSADQPADSLVAHPNNSWGRQPNYFVLYAFHRDPVNDFIPVGIYTKRSDADDHERALIETLGGRGNGKYCGAVVPRSHEELCYDLADMRMAGIAENIRQLLKLEIPRNAHGVDQRAHKDLAMLYGKDEFPVAIAQPSAG